MQRRSFLQGTAAIGGGLIAGCTRFMDFGEAYRLWFIRIHNGTTRQRSVDLRVFRDSDLIFEREYTSIPSFRATEEQDATFAAMDSARLVEGEWELKAGSYSVEYRFSSDDSYHRVTISEIEDLESEDVGMNIQLLGRSHSQPRVGFKLYQFTSDDQASGFVENVSQETVTETSG